jgi:hypothetical protein
MRTIGFCTADILMMFMDAHRKEFHTFAQEFGEYSRRDTSDMVTAIINISAPNPTLDIEEQQEN